MVRMGSRRQENYMSQDALCLGGTLKILLYSGKIPYGFSFQHEVSVLYSVLDIFL